MTGVAQSTQVVHQPDFDRRGFRFKSLLIPDPMRTARLGLVVTPTDEPKVLIIGAGPAGLTAAYELSRHGITSTIIEATDVVGGISQTVERNGWRFDIGGHRFFTKVSRVEAFWHEILADDEFLLRPRMSRIYYNGKFFDYPLRAVNALANLGVIEAVRCAASYASVRVRPPEDQSNFEGWVAARFGWRLYRTFFKTYTEKVWGIPATEIQADWAAQRIKNLSLGKAVVNAVTPKGRNSTDVTSLIEQFQYPRLGPGMMWEVCASKVVERGSTINFETTIERLERNGDHLVATLSDGEVRSFDYVISTMPINELPELLTPSPPARVDEACTSLKHRDFLTVALVIPEEFAFPDNWIYIHSPEVRVGRIQNYGSWSPYMVKEGQTCLGLEYFVTAGDDLWNADDEDLKNLAIHELEQLGLVPQGTASEAYVVRYPKAYPVYDTHYSSALAEIRSYLELDWPEIFPVGRNGMHRYNNQDHSMLTAMLAADEIATGVRHDPWTVNVEEDYHEETTNSSSSLGTGRGAPTINS